MIRFIFRYFFYRMFRFRGKNNTQSVLISYLPHALRSNSIKHANYLEMRCIFEVFRGLDYDIDVVFYDSNVDVKKNYSVLFGFGEPIERALINGVTAPVILYSTGLSGSFHNELTINGYKRRYDNDRKYLRHLRFVQKCWPLQKAFCDRNLILGSKSAAETFGLSDINVALPAVYNELDLIDDADFKEHRAVWVGGAGAVHKGLDLLLSSDQLMHFASVDIFGAVPKELIEQLPDNVHYHGFQSVESDLFKRIVSKASIIVAPSFAEGVATSVMNVVGNTPTFVVSGAYSGLTYPHQITLDNLDQDDIDRALMRYLSLEFSEIKRMAVENMNFVKREHGVQRFKDSLRDHVLELAKK